MAYVYTDPNQPNRTAYAEKVELRMTGKRNNAAQKKAGGTERLSSDEGGHLIAHILNGSSGKENLIAMDRGLNRGEYKNNEKAIQSAVQRNPDKQIDLKVNTNGSPNRPDTLQVSAIIKNSDGNILDISHNSYTNLPLITKNMLNIESGTEFEGYVETLTKEQRVLADDISSKLDGKKIVSDGLNTGWIYKKAGEQQMQEKSLRERIKADNQTLERLNQVIQDFNNAPNSFQRIGGRERGEEGPACTRDRSAENKGIANNSSVAKSGLTAGGISSGGKGGHASGGISSGGKGGHASGGISSGGKGGHASGGISSGGKGGNSH